ncbi:phosphonate metabolism protein/1,5-bisphosphokinase (PRPP-forming) PhnN [uncultured Bartonella sp.]|uniref:phosphonate metabolism protein/1,5-bisphosphokinase (PRPP-forming) PhnN n=1 Tax=uncultured Bartonella sp. TaxID=104108 RepID=UPI0025DC3757|nr:phosphonate metabolism protein/1,5-bisphosphokinase (PRPP-forming) PhnN [uncultured Bartonella sp.]
MLSNKKPGWFVAIVGPSGAGKDTIMNAVHEVLKNNPEFLFVRRIITRKAGINSFNDHDETSQNIGNEDNIGVSLEKFFELSQKASFSLQWFAHGIHYALPIGIVDEVHKGKIVIANVSRAELEHAKELFGKVYVIEINAPIEILKERLLGRKREKITDIEERLKRANIPIHLPEGSKYCYIDNSGNVNSAVDKMLSILQSLSSENQPLPDHQTK